eukprot:9492501-Pyramimonas_sp.AAC.1
MAAGFPRNPSCPSGRPDHPPVRTGFTTRANLSFFDDVLGLGVGVLFAMRMSRGGMLTCLNTFSLFSLSSTSSSYITPALVPMTTSRIPPCDIADLFHPTAVTASPLRRGSERPCGAILGLSCNNVFAEFSLSHPSKSMGTQTFSAGGEMQLWLQVLVSTESNAWSSNMLYVQV